MIDNSHLAEILYMFIPITYKYIINNRNTGSKAAIPYMSIPKM